jgi:cytidylate kinase
MAELDLTIIIIGKICSGKSTLAKDFARWVGYPIASFGSFLKDYSVERQLPIDRAALQDLGNSFIEKDPNTFLGEVIAHQNSTAPNLIFEGVRHKVILDEIRAISMRSFAIYIDATETVRLERFIKREKDIDKNNAALDFTERSGHVVEQEVEDLKQYCDFTLIANQGYQEFLKAIALYN